MVKKSRGFLWGLAGALLLVAGLSGALPAATPPQGRVLLLYSNVFGLPAHRKANDALLGVLADAGVSPALVNHEYLDLVRNNTPAYRRLLPGLLREKYAGAGIAAIVTIDGAAQDFLLEEGRELFPEAPIISVLSPKPLREPVPGRRIIQIPAASDFSGTLKVALTLFPATRRVFFVVGDSEDERQWLKMAREALAPWAGALQFEYTNGLAHDELLRAAAQLPPDSIVFFLSFYRDRAGRPFVPRLVADEVFRAAARPAFGIYDGLLGAGIVGGSLFSYEAEGARAGEMVRDILAGKRVVAPLAVVPCLHRTMFDWRQLRRWGVGLGALPAGAVVVGRPPTIWGQYRGQVAAAVFVLLLQSLLIALLLVHRRLRRRAELALRQSEERFRGFADAVPDLLYTTDVNGVLTYASPSAAVLMGWSPEEAVGRSFVDFLPPEQVPPAAAAFRAAIEEGAPANNLPLTVRRKDGTFFFGELNGRRISTTGAVAGTIGLIRDVSGRKRAEEELREAHRLLTKVQALAKLGGWNYEADTRTITWTDEVYRIHGVGVDFDPSNVEKALAFYEPEDRRTIAAAFQRAVTTGEPYDLELRFVRADGERLWVRTMCEPVLENGTVGRVTGTIADITERKRAEQQIRELNATLERRVAERTAELQSANRELEAIVYSIAHDLRAPLRAVDGYSGILEEEYGSRLDEEGRRLLGVVRAGAHGMDRLIGDLLEYSRTGIAELHREPVDLQAEADAAYAEVATEEARLTIRFSVGELPQAEGDAALLRRVWCNLLANAIKFTLPREERAIEVGGSSEGGVATYWVRDSGVGFNQAYAGKLFKIFQRLHAAEAFEGTGVGLAIVQRIVNRHGGRVWATGELGRGATFFFTLPCPPGAGARRDGS